MQNMEKDGEIRILEDARISSEKELSTVKKEYERTKECVYSSYQALLL